MHVYLLATLDTKGIEAAFARERLVAAGVAVLIVDVGGQGTPLVTADIPRETVFAAAGSSRALAAATDRAQAVSLAASGVTRLVVEDHAAGKVAGVLGLGGSAGTAIATAAMRALPLEVPKVMVSTLASGQTRHYVADKNIVMVNAVADIAGLNRVSRMVLDQAAAAMAGMLKFAAPDGGGDKPLVVASMFGVTTPCVERARGVLEAAGCEVLVFHATGAGGQAMESLVAEGQVAGVLDITTTELADELVGGVLSAGPDRLTAAARRGVPQVVSVGATDMVNFHAIESIPGQFAHRRLQRHNAHVTLMRTSAEENERIGAEIGRKVAASTAPAAILLPKRGVSAIDREGQPFDDPAARAALFAAIRRSAPSVPILELDCHINDAEFATRAAEKLLELMRAARPLSHGA